MPTKPHKPVLITLPPDWLEAFRLAARRDGLSLSRWLAESGRTRLPAAARKRLSEPRKQGPQPE